MPDPATITQRGLPTFQGQAVIGGALRLRADVHNPEGEETDATVVCRVGKNNQPPEGTETVQHDDTGRYYVDLDLDTAGPWVVRWEASGALQGAAESEFYVHDSQLPTP